MAILPLKHRLQTSGVDLSTLEDCPPDWLIPVTDIEAVLEADYNHAWIDQEERVFILNFSGDGFVRVDNNDVWESIEHIEQLIGEIREDLTTVEGDVSKLQDKYKEQDIRLDGVDDALINLGLDMSNKADKVPLAGEGNLTILDIDGQYQDSGVSLDSVSEGLSTKADRVSDATEGNLASLDTDGQYQDSGIGAGDIALKVKTSKQDNIAVLGTDGQYQDSGISIHDLGSIGNGGGGDKVDYSRFELNANKVDLNQNNTSTQYPNAKSVYKELSKKADNGEMLKLFDERLKIPIELERESQLPKELSPGDTFIVTIMDVTSMGFSGRIWVSLDNNGEIKINRSYNMPPGMTAQKSSMMIYRDDFVLVQPWQPIPFNKIFAFGDAFEMHNGEIRVLKDVNVMISAYVYKSQGGFEAKIFYLQKRQVGISGPLRLISYKEWQNGESVATIPQFMTNLRAGETIYVCCNESFHLHGQSGTLSGDGIMSYISIQEL